MKVGLEIIQPGFVRLFWFPRTTKLIYRLIGIVQARYRLSGNMKGDIDMAKKTKEELLNAINAIENMDADTQISLIEDITDTMDSLSNSEDWEKKYHELDDSWKKKYKDRFFSSAASEPEDLAPPEPKKLSFADLFSITD